MRMRIPVVSVLSGAALVAALAAPGRAQAVALPLRGQGELDVPDGVQDVYQGSVLLGADSSVKVVFIEAGTPRTVLAGRWRMADGRTAELAVHSVIGCDTARGTGALHFRPDGSVEDLEAHGTADGEQFALSFENSTTVAMADSPSPAPRAGNGEWLWAGSWAVLDVARHGEGVMKDAEGRVQRFDRARLTLGENDEFLLVLDGDARAEFAGTWRGDLRASPVQLRLREAMGRTVDGVGRAWIRERSWDRDWSFERVELDGWNDEGGDAFTLYFEAERP